VNVCGITAGSVRRVLCWGDSRDIAVVPDDLEPAGISELTAVGRSGRDEL